MKRFLIAVTILLTLILVIGCKNSKVEPNNLDGKIVQSGETTVETFPPSTASGSEKMNKNKIASDAAESDESKIRDNEMD